MPEKNNAPLPNGFELEGYVIDKRLSLGGFSIVYLAHDRDYRQYAIKEYLPHSLALRAPGEIRPTIPAEHLNLFRHGLLCFFEEGRALARLAHPNVVRVINFFRANDTVYLVMKYEHGSTLQVYAHKSPEVRNERFLRYVFIHLMNGLRTVHAQKLLHLDIKPANIYIRRNKTPVLLDFGSVKKALSSAAENLPKPMYTPGFASPEHYGDRAEIGPWSDIYGIGASLYTCLSKTTPQPADERLKNDKLTPASKRWRGEYSQHFLETMDQCLQLDHRARLQSAFALQKRLAERGDLLPNDIDKSGKAAWLARFFRRLEDELAAPSQPAAPASVLSTPPVRHP
ncbi:MAG: serine/threonine protein kinase [Zoogloeaceae bacterium]|jgi:serine/threonine protein kinase|nr:serine/threonine protein kinase [Zoogloeaceae bacterium]